MPLSTAMLAATLVAMTPEWAIIDLPYPDVSPAPAAGAALDSGIAEAVEHYARTKAPAGARGTKPAIAPLRVESDSASLRLTFADRSEIVVLARVKNEWRVVRTVTEEREF